MIDGLIGGKLHEKPLQRNSKNGNAFVTAKVRVADGQGESIFANVIAFSDSAKAALLALDAGDSVSIAGTLTPKAWIDKHGEAKPALDVQAHAVLSAYHVKRKRDAVATAKAAPEKQAGGGDRDDGYGPMDGEGF